MKKFGKVIKIIIAVVLAAVTVFSFSVTAFAEGDTPEMPVIKPKVPKITGVSLVLSGEIGLVYYAYIPVKYIDGYFELYRSNGEKYGEKTVTIESCRADDGTCKIVYNLSAIELSEEVSILVHAKDGTVLTTKVSWSAEKYAKQLVAENTATKKEIDIAKALINYGHYAQLACAAVNGWQIGADHPETTAFNKPVTTPAAFVNYPVLWQNKTEDFTKVYMSLNLDYNIGINLYVPVANKPTVTVNGESAEPTPSTKAGGTYKIEINGINALNLDKTVEVKVNNTTLTLSAFSYPKLALLNNKSTEDTLNAMCALYDFYLSVKNYNS